MQYQMLHTGREICISKKKDIHISIHKKKEVQPEQVIGSVHYRELKDPSFGQETDDRDHLMIDPFGSVTIDQEYKGRLYGYLEVTDPKGTYDGEGRYLAIYKSKTPLFLLWLSIALILLAAICVMAANRPRDMPALPADTELGLEDTYEYDDSPVAIETPGGSMANVEGDDEQVVFNVYAGVYRVAPGEALPLTNRSGNTVYLRYVLKDADGELIYETNLIAPKGQCDFIPSEHLEQGSTEISMYVECYDMDKSTKYPGGCLFDITIINE